jgi:DNA topoisomerase-6 subunit A
MDSEENTKGEQKSVAQLQAIAARIYEQLVNEKIPTLTVSTRTKANIVLDDDTKVWKYGDGESVRTAKSKDGAFMLLRTMYSSDFIKEMIKQRKSSTLRELYYISEGWGLAQFHEQQESDKLIEDLEIITECLREDFHLRPEENGASIIGDITIEETIHGGKKKKINCRDDVGDAGYSIPYSAEKDRLRFKETNAKFVIAVESGGMFDRLIENGFDEKTKALVVHLKGQPARSTRRLLKRLNEELHLPITVFTDGDPWSYRIYASVAYGAIKSAHVSEYLATPSAMFIGVTPSDIVNYKLPTDKLREQDVAALNAELTDPRFKEPFWQGEIKLQLDLGKKAEQQSLAKYGLEYVTTTYLPEKLQELNVL